MNRRERRAAGAYPRRFRSVRTSPRGFRLMFPGLTAPVDYNGSPIKPGQAELTMWRLRRDLSAAQVRLEALRDDAAALAA